MEKVVLVNICYPCHNGDILENLYNIIVVRAVTMAINKKNVMSRGLTNTFLHYEKS